MINIEAPWYCWAFLLIFAFFLGLTITMGFPSDSYTESWECVEWEQMNTIDCRMKVNLSEPINWDELDKSYEEYQEGLNDDWVCEIIVQSQTCTKQILTRVME